MIKTPLRYFRHSCRGIQGPVLRRFQSSCSGPVISPKVGADQKTLRVLYPSGKVTYEQAAEIQDRYVRKALDSKASGLSTPPPTLLCFEMDPVYTIGRRERGKLSETEREHLNHNGAHLVETLRGGQTTFHGPGQLVAYPIVDLRALHLPVRCYVRILENSIINTLSKYGISSKITDNTGVWINDNEKIAAIGIHVRRSVTSHGMALNVATDTAWFDRIVACGLPDKSTTTMAKQGVETSIQEVAQVFSAQLASALDCNKIEELPISRDGIN